MKSLSSALRWVILAAALGYIADKTPPLFTAARAEVARMGEWRWGWVTVSVVLGVAAVALYGEVHRRLLRIGGARLSSGTVQSITFAENAVAETLPVVGGAGAVAYAISRFHRRGADTEVASWAVLVAGSVSTVCLVALIGVALTAVGKLPVVWGAVLAVAAVASGVAGAAFVGRPAALRRLAHRVLHVAERVGRRCPVCRSDRLATAQSRVDDVAARLGLLRPSRAQWLVLVVISVLAYVLDYTALGTVSAAILPGVPWAALVWGYLLVQGSIALQVLPGGAGLADVGLLGALVGGGVPAAPAAGVVLVYRVCSWLLPAAIGWIVYGAQIPLVRRPSHVHIPRQGPPRRQPVSGVADLDAERTRWPGCARGRRQASSVRRRADLPKPVDRPHEDPGHADEQRHHAQRVAGAVRLNPVPDPGWRSMQERSTSARVASRRGGT
jgi:uncharacterized protein (TIRG00374 family)